MVIKAGRGFQETHDGTVGTMDAKGWLRGGVHGDTAEFADSGKGKDVGKGIGVVPNGAEIGDIAEQGGFLCATIGVDEEVLGAAANVGKVVGIAEHGNGQLTVEQDPVRGDNA